MDMWEIFLIVSALFLVLSVVFAIIFSGKKYKFGSGIDSSKILFVGVIFSAVFLFVPIYFSSFKTLEGAFFETLLLSVHNMIRLFIVDGEFSFIMENLEGVSPQIARWYSVLFAVLFVMAPLMTFGFVLSFFKNLSAYRRYITHYRSDVFVFSELNEKSLILAKSLYNKHKKRLFVFTDVFEAIEEKHFDMLERAKELGAVCFKKDIISVNFSFHSKKNELNFFVIGKNSTKNISQSLKIIEDYKFRENTSLLVFSTSVESEILLSNAFNDFESDKKTPKIKVRRINEVQSLIFRNLYINGYKNIFDSAYIDTDNVKKINAVVVGMGQHGTEMTKALSWYCQMDGYHVQINSFDIDKKAKEKFESLCPELMSPGLNGNFIDKGEAMYKINVYSDVDVDTKAFDNILESLPPTTYVFVALGNDEKNIAVSVKLRALFLRFGYSPVIQAVVYNSEMKEALNTVRNFKKQDYKIDFIGDLKNAYSEEVILSSDLEAKALARHLKWGNEEDFWRYDYNYKSSIASALHYQAKIDCGIPGITKKADARTEEELWAIRTLEHRRWNAYMRSEGFVFAGTIEKSGRNDLAKMHNCLVTFSELPLSEQIKDDD